MNQEQETRDFETRRHWFDQYKKACSLTERQTERIITFLRDWLKLAPRRPPPHNVGPGDIGIWIHPSIEYSAEKVRSLYVLVWELNEAEDKALDALEGLHAERPIPQEAPASEVLGDAVGGEKPGVGGDDHLSWRCHTGAPADGPQGFPQEDVRYAEGRQREAAHGGVVHQGDEGDS